jgi:RNA polymerase sigma-70 factor (ECF subfamily)
MRVEPSAGEHMPDVTELADDQLIMLVAEGDPSALEALYDRYVRQCYGLALRLLSNPSLAEEVVQEVFLKLWTQPTAYSPDKGRFASWLLSMVHHRAVDELRRRSYTEASLDSYSQPGTGPLASMPSSEPDPGEQVWVMEQQRIVRAALDQIADSQRQILELAYFGGLSQSQIAERLRQPLGTVKTRMRQGLKNLRALLETGGLLNEPQNEP